MITLPGKIPITIRPLFWLIAALIGWMSTYSVAGTLSAILVILFSVLIHEFGHALTALFFHQKVRIELAAFGGFTYREGRKLRLWEEFLVVLNGPLSGLLLGVLAYFTYTHFSIANPALLFILKFTAMANFFWTVMNLVPLLPLDGGHLLSIILEAIFGFRGVKMAILVGFLVGISLTIAFFLIGAFLLGALFLILTFECFRSFRYYRLLTDKDRSTMFQNMLKAAESDLKGGNIESAIEKFSTIRERTKEGLLYTVATQELARLYRHQDKFKDAYTLLFPIKKTLKGEMLTLFHFLAFQLEDFHEVIHHGEAVYQETPSYDIALINAYANGALGKEEAALGWLECAIREGLPNLKSALLNKDFDPIRNTKNFKEFIQEHS